MKKLKNDEETLKDEDVLKTLRQLKEWEQSTNSKWETLQSEFCDQPDEETFRNSQDTVC